MKKISSFTIGTDPEFFLRNKETGQFISAEGLIGGSKNLPIKISKNGHAIQEDGVMLEINVPPSKTSKEMKDDIDYVLTYVSKEILPANLEIVTQSSAVFSNEDLATRQASTLGCDPDFNAWNNKMNKRPHIKNINFRSAGFHVHIGYSNPDYDYNLAIIKAFDLFLGVPSIIMDSDTLRKQLYGKAGCFRHQNYGVEYRVLGNFIGNDEAKLKWMFNNIEAAVEFVNSNISINNQLRADILNCINTNNKKIAYKICKEMGIAHLNEKLITLNT